MTQATFSNGFVVSDGDEDGIGLASNGGYGYTTLLLLAFTALIEEVQLAIQAALDAEAAATTAFNAPGTQSTSTDTETLSSSASVAFTTQTGKAWAEGMYVRAASRANPSTHWMAGFVTGYSGSTLTIQMTDKGSGSGDRSDWTITHAATSAGDVPQTRQINALDLASGGGPLSGDVTITVSAANASEVRAGSSNSKAVTPQSARLAIEPVAASYASTVTLDLTAGIDFTIGQMTGDMLLALPNGTSQHGRKGAIRVSADATGRTITFASGWTLPKDRTQLELGPNGVATLFYRVEDNTDVEVNWTVWA